MASLNSPIVIRNSTVRNRIVLPPLVICAMHPRGGVNETVLDHYESFARGGCGAVIVEATCVLPEGRLAGPQLGLWEDAQIGGMARIAGRVLPHGALPLVQIHYASKQGEPDNVVQVGPSAYTNHDGIHRALPTAEVERIRDGFVAAAVRAEKAGFPGVELHGAHGYLLCAFMNAAYNQRDDRYGDLTFLPREIIAGIRQVTGPDFIVAARVGVDNPDVATGIANCRALEAAGLDLLSISHGMGRTDKLPVPDGFPFKELTWLGCEVKKHVHIPIIAVGGLNDPEKARKLVGEGWADFAAVGRGMLVDPEWANKVLAGQPVNKCYDCKKGCVWFREHEKCPGRRGVPPVETRPALPY
jgi:NADPH2 dehydrogenase